MKPSLKKKIGLFEATTFGVGIILGAGIYALIGPAAGAAGNALWISFIIGAIISSFTGLSYAELSTMFPKAAKAPGKIYQLKGSHKAIGDPLANLVNSYSYMLRESLKNLVVRRLTRGARRRFWIAGSRSRGRPEREHPRRDPRREARRGRSPSA